MERPNILFIHCDSMDGRAMGWMGHPAADTPTLDRLAERGTAFSQAYCTSPQCVPSRSSFMSGRYVHELEAWNNFKGLEGGEETLIDDAAAAGYRTHEIGRRDHRSGAHSLGARLTAWLRSADLQLPQKNRPSFAVSGEGTRGPRDWEHVDACCRQLREYASDNERPFFISLGMSTPHPGGGYRATRDHLERIPAASVSVPPDDPLDHPVMRKMSIAKHTYEPADEQEIIAIRRHYLAMVREVDAMVAQVMDVLQETGLRERTHVIFFSDHGDMQMEHRQWLKNAQYEASARVPLILCGPDLPRGMRIDNPVSLIDLRATLADLGSYSTLATTSGNSLLDFTRSHFATANGSSPGPVFGEYHSNMQCTGSFMVREGNWKYIAYPGYEPQLFNLEDDPEELQNRATREPDVVERLDATLREFCDYRLVDRHAKANDRQCYRAWCAALSDSHRQHILRTIFSGFDKNSEIRIGEWLGG